MTTRRLTRMQAFERSHDIGINASDNATFDDVLDRRFGRRAFLAGAFGAAAAALTGGRDALADPAQAAGSPETGPRFSFTEVEAGVDENHHVAPGYKVDIVARWGDAVLGDAPAFDPLKQSADAQKKQFGYNSDFVGYIPMPGSDASRHGLLVVNHEYTNEELMFPGLGRQDVKDADFKNMTADLVAVEMAAHGGSVVEVRRGDDGWRMVAGSRYARRIDAETPVEITGPAAGHARMRTSADPSGRAVRGMLNNCAGGVTPWGTWLTCEENFHGYFWGKLEADHAEARNLKRYGVPARAYAWGKFHDRFDITKEPHEANRFGWVVEIDPFDPRRTASPVRRTC